MLLSPRRIAAILLSSSALLSAQTIDTAMLAKIRAEAVAGSQVSQVFDTLTHYCPAIAF